MAQNSTPRSVPERTESRYSDKYLYMHVHSSVIHTTQNIGPAHVSIHG